MIMDQGRERDVTKSTRSTTNITRFFLSDFTDLASLLFTPALSFPNHAFGTANPPFFAD